MPYFNQDEIPEKPHEPLFAEPPAEDGWGDESGDWDDIEEPLDETYWQHLQDRDMQEDRLRRQDQLRLISGVGDFLLVVAGTAAVLALVALIISLVIWVRDDITQRFPVVQSLTGAVRDGAGLFFRLQA